MFISSLSSLVYCLRVRPEPNRMKHLSGAPLYGRLLASPTNTRLGWKGLPGINTLAYYENSLITPAKSFIVQAPRGYTRMENVKGASLQQRTLKFVNNCLNTNIYSYLVTPGG